MTTYICRRDGDVFHELLFHLLNLLTVLKLIAHLITHLSDRLVLIFLQTLTGTVNHLQPVVDLLFYILCHIGIGNLDTVDICLMNEELLNSYLFGDGTVGITVPLHTLHCCLHTHALYVRLQDSLITNNPYHLVDDTVGWRDGVVILRCSLKRTRYCGDAHKGY